MLWQFYTQYFTIPDAYSAHNTHTARIFTDGWSVVWEKLMSYRSIWLPNMYLLEFQIHLTRCMACVRACMHAYVRVYAHVNVYLSVDLSIAQCSRIFVSYTNSHIWSNTLFYVRRHCIGN